jgi:ABC-type multidrug transport system ATPase subunit/pSer/pThr/pTyr-binding forkhead associated (FHA) protein
METVNSQPTLASIKFLTGSLAGSTYQITKPKITLGREPANDIVLSDTSVSRHHAQITLNNGTWTITKLARQNTVIVNHRNVQQSAINDRDTIGLGGTSFLFQINVGAPHVPHAPQANPPKVAPTPASFTPQQSFQDAPPPPLASFVAQQPVPAQRQNKPAPFDTEPVHDVPSLEVTSNTHPEKTPYPLTKQLINIGRHPSNDIVINENVVSAYHAQIVREGNQLIFIHPHPQQPRTTNGLLYQGRRIPGNEPFRKPLERGDIFRIGDDHGTLVTLSYNDGSAAAQDIAPAIRPIPLGAPQISLGRHPNNTVFLNHPQVSAHHARLQQVQGGYRIVDLGSTNGVYVNALRVTNQLLKPGDEVRIGPFKLTYTGTHLTQQDESNSVRIDAVHLKKFGNKQVVLLNDISIAIPPRKFVALVGGSGTGKSTLMGALNGLRPAESGMVFYNGQDYYKHLAAFSTQLGYVPQDDIIHRDLPVERALYYAAKMRLPDDFTGAQIQQRINEVLEDVEIAHRRHLMVSKLSGGQRKRVSIALELLANPSVFFLDEPTSGLDPGLDRKMMFLLRRLADKGHTIVLVTHATNNINACDYVCFLAQGGRLAYFGPPGDAKKYFDKTDFAEIYSALEPTEQNPNIPAEAEARFKVSPYYRQYVQEPLAQGPAARASVSGATVALKQPMRGNPWKQFILLSMRYIELLKNDRGNLMILLLQAPIIALILFLLAAPDVFSHTNIVNCPPNAQIPQTVPNKFDCQNVVNALKTPQGQISAAQRHLTVDQALQKSFNPLNSGANAQKILFIMAFAAVMFGCINGTREIVKEEPIYRRERTVNLGIMPYMFSKIVVLGILCLLQSAVLVIIVALRAPFDHSTFLPPLVEMYISLALTSLAGLMLGLAISALAPNNDRAASFIPIILIPQVIFSGIIFQLNSPLLQILGSFFAARWSMAALGSSVGLHADLLGNEKDFAYQGTLFTKVYPTAADQLAATAHLLLMWFALVVMIVVLAAATAYFLKRKDV